MKIVTLVENIVKSGNLWAEHGLALYLETDNRKILFDTGQSGLFMQNAEKLGIPVEEIDSVILSHGHYDHTGGLYPFLERNNKAVIYAKEEIFIPKYCGKSIFAGTPLNESLIKDRIIFVDRVTELDENVFIMPHTKIYFPVDTHFKEFNKKVNDRIVPDEFDDELFLTIKHNNKLNILTACSHRGVTNICETANNHFNLPVRLILGGFHMSDCTTEQYVHILYYFRTIKLKTIGLSHCNGLEKYAAMYQECESHLFYNYTGNTIRI